MNLETRRGQPGRYRLTGQKVEPEEVMPLPDTLLPPVPPCHRSPNSQVIEIHSGVATGGTVAAVADLSVEFEELAATLEYDGGLDRQVAEAEAYAAVFPDIGDIPDFLDRRPKRSAA